MERLKMQNSNNLMFFITPTLQYSMASDVGWASPTDCGDKTWLVLNDQSEM